MDLLNNEHLLKHHYISAA